MKKPKSKMSTGTVIKPPFQFTKEHIVDQYTTTGVPMTSITAMCKELHISEKKLMKWLSGQTMGLVGGVGMVYPWDIKRFVNNQPIID